jgi:hypothetical protein
MKRLLLMLCVAAAYAACGDGTTDGANPDSTVNAPNPEYGRDSTVHNDSIIDTTTTPRDTMRRN